MNYKRIDAGMRPLFQSLAETGISLDEKKLLGMIQGFQRQLAEQKQTINRKVGFTVNIDSDDHWHQAMQVIDSELVLNQILGSRVLGSLIRKLQQVYDLANGNSKILDRSFGLYPKYDLDMNGKITTISELALNDLPEESLMAISRQDRILIKATYSDIISKVVQKLANDSGIDVKSFIHNLAKSQNIVSSLFGRTAIVPEIESERSRFVVEFPIESTAMDLAKMGFINLFEDYRIGRLESQIFALTPYSAYLFAPNEHVELISSVYRECLENAHSDFTLIVDITVGKSLTKLM
jgi:hypothetical protein